MKKIFFALIMTCLLACNVDARQYEVNGLVEGLEDGTVLELVPMSHDGDEAIAQATVTGGKFAFKGQVGEQLPYPMCVILMVKDSYGSESLMLEPGTVSITGKVSKGQPNENEKCSYTWKVQVNGGAENAKLNGYKAKRVALDKQFSDYHEKYADVQRKLDEARAKKDDAAAQAIQQSEQYNAYMQAEKDFFATVERTYKGILDENHDTYWGPMMAIYLWTYFTAQDKALYDSFTTQAQQSWYGKRMLDEIMPAGNTGEKAKEFAVKGDDGKQLSMADLAKGKKVLLVDFWASWCKPCRNEIPNVKKQYELYKDKGFEVVSISIDSNEKAWRKALEQEQLQWPNYLDRMGAANVYKVKSIPAMFLIDATNLSVIASGEDARGEALAAKLAELFAK